MKAIILLSLFSAVSCDFFSKSANDYYAKANLKVDQMICPEGEMATVDGCVAEPYNPQKVSENFVQKASAAKLDILWVIDNSGSMSEEQANLSENFNEFMPAFIDNNIDFQMAITTTDPTRSTVDFGSDKCGKLVAGSENLNSISAKSDAAAVIASFESLMKVGTSGSGNEQGLNAVNCFSAKNDNLINVQKKFFRPDAYLAIVYVSDEEDSSPGSAADAIAALQARVSEAHKVKAYAIVDKFLVSRNGNTPGFQRYEDVAVGTGGQSYDIFGDFSESLANMSNDLVSLIDSFVLKSQPIDGSLKVYVDGVLSNNYSYDAASKSIKFNVGSVPVPLAKIKVTYLK